MKATPHDQDAYEWYLDGKRFFFGAYEELKAFSLGYRGYLDTRHPQEGVTSRTGNVTRALKPVADRQREGKSMIEVGTAETLFDVSEIGEDGGYKHPDTPAVHVRHQFTKAECIDFIRLATKRWGPEIFSEAYIDKMRQQQSELNLNTHHPSFKDVVDLVRDGLGVHGAELYTELNRVLEEVYDEEEFTGTRWVPEKPSSGHPKVSKTVHEIRNNVIELFEKQENKHAREALFNSLKMILGGVDKKEFTYDENAEVNAEAKTPRAGYSMLDTVRAAFDAASMTNRMHLYGQLRLLLDDVEEVYELNGKSDEADDEPEINLEGMPFMCSVNGGQAPRITHPTYEDAVAEAKRLAAQTKKEVCVLQQVAFVRAEVRTEYHVDTDFNT